MAVYLDSNGNLVIESLTGNTNVNVNAINLAQVAVTINNQNQGNFDLSGGGRVIIRGSITGNNYIQVTGNIATEIYGGDGNDTIYGGNKDDIIQAGEGNNLINSRATQSIVIAGGGRNSVQSSGNYVVEVGGHLDPLAIDTVSGLRLVSYEYLHDHVLVPWIGGDHSGVDMVAANCTPKTGNISSFCMLGGGTGPSAYVAHISGSGTLDSLTNYNASKGDYKTNI